MTEPKTKSAPRKSKPGKIIGSFELVLNTIDAITLTQGRSVKGKHRIAGLRDYGSRTHLLYEASKKDDPFAIYQLVQIEGKEKEVGEFLKKQAQHLMAIQTKAQSSIVFKDDADSRIIINQPKSIKPVAIEFHVGNYATSAARLIKQFDDLALLARSMNHHNFLPTSETVGVIHRAASKIRGLLTEGTQYRFTGVTRNDLKAKNKLGRGAVQKLLATKFIDQDIFKDDEDICEYFAEYDIRPQFGPMFTASGTATNA